ncbi:zinc finger protein 782-like [Ostrinia nubilalis]|uniref:zinc finger protein 782-like n=1 Tax=Ostrinia nubilalis TaxID=29057 RepID=UPI0030825898
MSVNNQRGPVFDPGLCRCCGALKKCRLLNVEYDWRGQKEVYCDMFVDCFGLMLSNLDGEPLERLICATCVSRLREASSFRIQVLKCEETLLQARIHLDDEATESDIKKEPDAQIKVEVQLSAEPQQDPYPYDAEPHHGDSGSDRAYDSLDDNKPLSTMKSPKKSPKLKKSLKAKKKLKTEKKAKRKNSLSQEEKDRRQMLANIAKISEQLKRMHEDEIQLKPPKTIDNDHKCFMNAVAIVQNSYVCPFDSSFSDYYCVYCRGMYTDPIKLREHTLSHDPSAFNEYAVTKKQLMLDILRIDCRLCEERIDDIDILKNHLITSHDVKLHDVTNEFLKFKLTINNLTCIECNGTFSFFHALKKHMAEHFGSCICDVCGAHYFEERMLSLHMRCHQKTDEEFTCDECGKTFKSKHSRNLHVARLHRKEAAYECNKCDEVFYSYSLRYRHMIEAHGERRIFPCEHCDRVYDSRKSLREHNRRSHLKIFRHQCEVCDKRFYLPSRLKEHMATHTGERNFRCEFCGKSYPRLRGLKVHMQSHSAEKRYKCTLCSASFTQNVNLTSHIRRQHQPADMEEVYHE